METNNMFEQATRKKLRFETSKGYLTVEELWDLPLTSNRQGIPNLNDIAKSLNRAIKETENEEDFVHPTTTTASTTLHLAFDIVKHVIAIRMAENEEAKTAAEKKAKKQRLMELIEQKQDEKLKGSSLEELQEMVNSL